MWIRIEAISERSVKILETRRNLPSISFLFPCTISFPATFTREKFKSFPSFTTWLQFSTFLNGILIGGFVACFQITDPGETLSRTSKRTHLQYGRISSLSINRRINSWFISYGKTKTIPVSDVLENIVHICSYANTVNPQPEAPLLPRSFDIISHHFCKWHFGSIGRQPIPALQVCNSNKIFNETYCYRQPVNKFSIFQSSFRLEIIWTSNLWYFVSWVRLE